MTVDEVADYLKLSSIMVYKLAQQGRIPARKIGRIWRFAKDAIDEWMSVPHTSAAKPKTREAVTVILHDFVCGLRDFFGSRLRKVVLFGSHARGEGSDTSDIDTLVALDQVSSTDRRKVSAIAYAATFGQGRMQHLASIVMAEQRYLTEVTPLLLNIWREGKEAA